MDWRAATRMDGRSISRRNSNRISPVCNRIEFIVTTLYWLYHAGMADLKNLVDKAVAVAVKKFAAQKLLADELAVTLVDLRDLKNPGWADHRGDAPVYPASVVKLFYLVAAHRWMEDGKISDTPELRRALRDMIVDSSNEATAY